MRPANLSTLDASLAEAWECLRPLPHGSGAGLPQAGLPQAGLWCLGGGTAVARYLGHRPSTDLAWVAPPGAVEPATIAAQKSAFEPYGTLENISGGAGMVDCVLRPHDPTRRSIAMTFMEPHRGFLPVPSRPAVPASNPAATPVLHPVDLAACKLLALQNRRAERDYEDLAALCAASREHVAEALQTLEERESVSRHRMLALLADAPHRGPRGALAEFVRDHTHPGPDDPGPAGEPSP